MSSIENGINKYYSLTEQINKLKESGATVSNEDIASVQISLQKNFNDMLNNLIKTSNDDDDDDNSSDLFGSITDSNQAYIDNLTQQNTATDTSQTTDLNQSTDI